MKFLRTVKGFTVVELLLVTTILSSIPTGYMSAKNKALETQCASQLSQIGKIVQMFEMERGRYPDAVFYPEEPTKNPRSIAVILQSYGVGSSIFVCPTAPTVLKERGLTYLWNDELSGKSSVAIRNPSKTWMMTDMIAVDEKAVSLRGGCNILYVDGHVEWSSEPPELKPQN